MAGQEPSGTHREKGEMELMGAESASGEGRVCHRHLDEVCLGAEQQGRDVTFKDTSGWETERLGSSTVSSWLRPPGCDF